MGVSQEPVSIGIGEAVMKSGIIAKIRTYVLVLMGLIGIMRISSRIVGFLIQAQAQPHANNTSDTHAATLKGSAVPQRYTVDTRLYLFLPE